MKNNVKSISVETWLASLGILLASTMMLTACMGGGGPSEKEVESLVWKFYDDMPYVGSGHIKNIEMIDLIDSGNGLFQANVRINNKNPANSGKLSFKFRKNTDGDWVLVIE